ncbi:MAG: HNH endonuclease [Muribaculaceae bacterium]|nr:HNH endonuclease [Muribaculaceae bacterium]
MPTINRPTKKKPDTPYRKTGRNIDASKIYNSSLWRNLRLAHITAHPLCENCYKEGRITAAQEVHHVKPILTGQNIEEMQELAYNPDNLLGLCQECHHKIHQQLRNNP